MRLYFLLFTCKYPDHPVLVRKEIVADCLVEQSLLILLQLLDFCHSHPVVLVEHTLQQVHVLLDVVEVVDDVLRIGKIGKYQGMVSLGTELLNLFQSFLVGREYQFYVAIRITSWYNIDRFFTNHVVKEAWRAFLVKMGFDGRNPTIEEHIQLVNKGDRTRDHHSSLTYFCFKVNVSSLEKHQTLFIGSKADDFLCRQFLNNLFGIVYSHCLTGIVCKVPFC